jgi:methionine-R-sulfoxide reductase
MYGGRITSEDKSAVSTYVGAIIFILLVGGVVYFYLLAQNPETREFVGFDPNRPIPSDKNLRVRLKPEQYRVVREGFTQMPFQNEFWDNKRAGIYVDIITNEPLFTSVDKYDANIGMPTFSKPISKDLLIEVPDTSHDMQRIEVRAKRSNARLGHLFDDPQSKTGQRYAMNSACFHFIPIEKMKEQHYEAYLPLLEPK